jgi:Lon protease-like protein
MTAESLPSRFPIFPLPDVVLFPDVLLPLHMFEPRYRAMTEDQLEGDRVIGMVLLRPGADPEPRDAPVFDVGCAGRIIESRRLADGRFNLILRGERRFRIERELATGTPYRVAETRLLPDPAYETLGQPLRDALERDRERATALLVDLASESQPEALERFRRQARSLDPVAFIHALAFGVECTALEKQGLLEAGDALQRGRLLIELLQFLRAERGHPEGPESIN